MFCSQCGEKLQPNSKFCSSCGSQIAETIEQQLPSQKISKEQILSDAQSVDSVFSSENWVINQLKKYDKKSGKSYNQKVISRFQGFFHKPSGQLHEIVITPDYIAVANKFSWTSNSYAGVTFFEHDSVKLLLFGSVSHTQHMGTTASQANLWSLSIVNTSDFETFLYLPLGDTNYQMQKNIELYSAKVQILSEFWPVSLDGGHVDSSSGFISTYNVGFWHSI